MTTLKRMLLLASVIGAPGAAVADGPAADATQFTVYGALANAVVTSSNEGGHSRNYLRSGAFRADRLGFKGDEDLGDGTSAVFDLEAGYDVNSGAMTSSGVLFNRLAYAGLENRHYGTVLLGRQNTPYYRHVAPFAVTGPLSGATGTHPGDYDGLDTLTRVNDAVTYITPSMHGVRASAMVALAGTAGDSTSGDTVSAGVSYDEGTLTGGLGYMKFKNGARPNGGWDSSATANFSKSSLNLGYLSAASIEHSAAAIRYHCQSLWSVGANATHSAYVPGPLSLFTETAVFNTYGANATYFAGKGITFSAGYAYTRASAANGIGDAARYREFSFEQTYALSKQAWLYALEANTRASGATLGAGGKVVEAVGLIGENATSSSGAGQRITMLGLAVVF